MKNNRRGITLLFVVSMIVLFLLMGTAFVVVANDYLRASKKRARIDIHEFDGVGLLDTAIYDVLRGPLLENTESPLRGHSLLEDQYGYGFTANIAAVTKITQTNGQFFRVDLVGTSYKRVRPSATAMSVSTIPGEFIGQLFSVVSGSSDGFTSRIVSHSGNSFYVMPIWEASGNSLDAIDLTETNQVVINGREFSGTGAGGTTGSAPTVLTATALLPNRKGNAGSAPGDLLFTSYLTSDRSPNEPYDAADFQNQFLAGRDSGGNIIPSFHRDALVNYHSAVPTPSINQPLYSFRPFYDKLDATGAASPDGTPDPGHTANSNFMFNRTTLLDIDNDFDGTPDSVLIDIGLPIQSNKDGSHVKPLVAYYITDLDGRLNVNTDGRLAPTGTETVQAMVDSQLPQNYGAGYGPPEISLAPLFADTTDYQRVLEGRYGANTLPGDTANGNELRQKLFNYPRGMDIRLGGFYQSSPMDLFGRFAFGVPQYNDAMPPLFGDPHFGGTAKGGFVNSLPEAHITVSALPDEFKNSPYEMQFAARGFDDSDDSPYEAHELERLLRNSDVDSRLLSSRLFDMPTKSWKDPALTEVERRQLRDIVTTDSFEVPVPPQSIYELLRTKLPTTTTDAQKAAQAQIMLSREVLLGQKFDINRPFGGNFSGTAVVNSDQNGNPNMDFDNAGDQGTGDYNAQMEFARHLYVLTLLVCGDTPNIDADGNGTPNEPADHIQYKRSIAQWAINVADFRDTDSRMTKFEFDLNPFDSDGWTSSTGNIVWGMERPELLLTEAFATHDRRTEDEDTSDPEFESRLRPEASAFIELYNPWTQSTRNQILDTSLYTGNGVDLDRVSSAGNAPIWRIMVERPENTATGTTRKPLRAIYFANPTPIAGETDIETGSALTLENFYTTQPVGNLNPGRHAVIGSTGPRNAAPYRTTFGRLNNKTKADEAPVDNLQLNITRHIILGNNQVVRYEPAPGGGTTTVDQCVVIPINTPRSLAISDPNGGYPTLTDVPSTVIGDGLAYTTPTDPLDVSNVAGNINALELIMLRTDGLSERFRELKLQRLADPTRPWSNTNNPYLTIDKQSIDLLAFNGATSDMDPDATNGNTVFTSRERGTQDANPSPSNGRRLLWNRDETRYPVVSADQGDLAGADNHFLSYEFVESLGQTNDAYNPDTNNYTVAGLASSPPYPWLTWNNRPFVSHLELTNVPFTGPVMVAHLSDSFSVKPGTAISNPDVQIFDRDFHHLLNFRSPNSALFRLMDYVEVPSRFRGTETYFNPTDFAMKDTSALGGLQFPFNPPFHYVSSFRYPGKINLNTIYDEKVWQGLIGNRISEISFDDFRNQRTGTGATLPTNFLNVYRPADSAQYVPSNSLVQDELQTGLFRNRLSGTDPLFADRTATPRIVHADRERNAYFRDDLRQSLGNLTTCRSSVFAVWVTVAYFEVDENGRVGAEVGTETGNVRRNRAFCIVDRSIPVAFEPGKNHNIDRAILVKTIIE